MRWDCTDGCKCLRWKTLDGKSIRLCRLTDKHLINILKYATRRKKLHPKVFKEAKRRIEIHERSQSSHGEGYMSTTSFKIAQAKAAVSHLKMAIKTENARDLIPNKQLIDELTKSLVKAQARLAELTGSVEP